MGVPLRQLLVAVHDLSPTPHLRRRALLEAR
jgi:hypothetical protein